jgi:glutamate synthase (NADPH/NADH) large chain
VVVLGRTGRNFAAGMSGGIAYVYDPDYSFHWLVNYEMVQVEPLECQEQRWLYEIVSRHRAYTDSAVAERILDNWDEEVEQFRKVMPTDYKRVLRVLAEAEAEGLDEDERLHRVMEAAHG